MAGYRIPAGENFSEAAHVEAGTDCVAGFAPGPLATPVPPLHRRLSRQLRFTTNPGLMQLATSVVLAPAPDRAVFYAEHEGAVRASAFIAANPDYTRLDELLAQTQEGRQLAAALLSTARPWSDKEEVWWELSHRLAQAARGKVHVFGPLRLVEDRPLEEFRHSHQRNAYANTVFEKVEWPELEQNPAVTKVYYNGVLYDG